MTRSTRSRIGNVVGRLLVVVPFWTVLTYAVGALFGTVLVDLYGPSPNPSHAADGRDERAGLSTRAWCLRELHDLHARLETSARTDLQTCEATRATSRGAWIAAYQDLAETCGDTPDEDVRATYANLGALQLQVAAARDRIVRTRATIEESLRDTARSLSRR